MNNKITKSKGFSLIEVLIATTIICIVAVGPVGYHYMNIKQSRSADVQFMAMRIAQLLIEDWKSTGGGTNYDPTALLLGFDKPLSEEFGHYFIVLENVPFYIAMNSRDIENNPDAGVTLRQITVNIRWRTDYTRGAIRSTDPSITFDTYVRSNQG
ncbi:MAG: prepilin-type N-terminal cleavage/methylation domain-containing protein [Phycisphaerae bacterium]